MKQHYGQILEKAVRQSNYPISKLAKQIKYTRAHMYNLFKKPVFDVTILEAVGKIIHVDFSDKIKNIKRYVLEEQVNNELKETEIFYEKTNRRLEQKYLKLMEEYAAVLKENNQLHREIRRIKK
jgi:hypothetical protein